MDEFSRWYCDEFIPILAPLLMIVCALVGVPAVILLAIHQIAQ